ncbi:MAG: AarF/ABC1/UbiB kinase family protein [Candidatus Melainabacteria bacterium]|nr:AarF/ABC1/UbiB kinase family protein [Candidatus Melainabacteria bacterium]
MITVVEKQETDHKESTPWHLYYDTNIVQEKFKLLKKEKDFIREPVLLIYYCLRNKRFRQIAWSVFNLSRKITKNNVNNPIYVKNTLLELGSTFIKIGQFLSSRTDLLPKDYIEALSELQDSLPPLPFEEVKSIVEKELQKPIKEIFSSFDETSMASASIGQVHKAKLLNNNEVAVKVQKPNLSSLFYEDLAILRCFALFFEKYTKIGKDREWVGIIDEIGKTLFEEIDFIEEGRNADKFRKNLKYEEKIYIPKVFWKYTTRKILTIEFVPGTKIIDVKKLEENNLDLKELALSLVKAYFKQFFEDGFYHADPHPGNIVVKEDGTIVFYDFGMVARLNKNIREELTDVLFNVIENDTDSLLNNLKKLELLKKDVDVRSIKKVIEQAVYKYYDGAKLDSLDLNDMENELRILFKEKPMKLPSKFTYTLRMTGTLEGVCRTLDPEFSLISAAKDYFEGWIKSKLLEAQWKNFIVELKHAILSAFPNQVNLMNKIKIYFNTMKELPGYVAKKDNIKTVNLNPIEIFNSKEEIIETNSKLRVAYTIILLLCSVFMGNSLIQGNNYLMNISGLIMLIFSVAGSVGIVGYSIFSKKSIDT